MKKSTIATIAASVLSMGVLSGLVASINNKSALKVDAAISWEKHTGDLESGHKYVIVYDNYYLVTPTAAVTAKSGFKAASFDGISKQTETNVLTFSDDGAGNWTLSYTSGTSTYSLYVTNDNNGLRSSASNTNTWTVEEDAETAGSYMVSSSDGTNTRYLSPNGTTDWRTYKAGSYAKAISLYEATSASDVAASSIALTDGYATSIAAGETGSMTATLNSGCTETVNWTSSDPSVVSVSTTGTVSGVSNASLVPHSNGTATITATASTTTSVTVTSTTITVSGFSSSNAPKTFTADGLGLGSTYATKSVVANGVSVEFKNLLKTSSDYTNSSGITTYEKDAIQFIKNESYITFATNVGSKIKSVTISNVTNYVPSVTVKGGDAYGTYGETAAATTSSGTGKVYTFEFSTPVTFVSIVNGSYASYLNSITLNYENGVETVDSLASFINGLIPDRALNAGFCSESNGYYVAAKTRLINSPDSVVESFKTSDDAAVVAARTRYVHWCDVVGDNEPYGSTIVSGSFLNGMEDYSDATVVVIGALGLGAMALAFYFLKKKKLA